MTTSSDTQPPEQDAPERIWMQGNPRECSEIIFSERPRGASVEYVRADLPRATAEAELTVESALAELREMFPDNEITIDFAFRPDGWHQVSIFRFAPPHLADTILVSQGEKLNEAMDQVRV